MKQKSALNQSKNTLNVVGVITERWRRGGLYVIYLPAGENFGKGQAKGE